MQLQYYSVFLSFLTAGRRINGKMEDPTAHTWLGKHSHPKALVIGACAILCALFRAVSCHIYFVLRTRYVTTLLYQAHSYWVWMNVDHKMTIRTNRSEREKASHNKLPNISRPQKTKLKKLKKKTQVTAQIQQYRLVVKPTRGILSITTSK